MDVTVHRINYEQISEFKMKIICIFISTLVILLFCGCENSIMHQISESNIIEETEIFTESETEPETVEMSSLRVKSRFKSPQEVTLTREDADELLSLIPPGGWKRGITKSLYHYIFYLEDGRILYYTATTQNTTGMFNDQTNQRHIYINQTKTDWISNVLDKYFSD